jgi:hypothetical protein
MLSPTCSLKDSRHFAYLQHFLLSVSMPYKHLLQKSARDSISYYSNCITSQIAQILSCEYNKIYVTEIAEYKAQYITLLLLLLLFFFLG